MQRTLCAAGVPASVLELVRETVETCSVCRTWTRPGPDTVASGRIVIGFNVEVEGDMLFITLRGVKHTFLHLVDRGVRWEATKVIRNRTTTELLEAIDSSWISIFGPMQVLIFDGETGLNDDESETYFRTKGIKKRTSAPGQHVRVADRRASLLKTLVVKIWTQLCDDSLTVSFPRALAEATFVGKAMLTIGGASPYTAVLRRTPALLPGMKCPPDETGTVARDSQRMREISIQKITETTSRERTNRALRTLTKPAGEEIRYQLGDEREYWQEPSRKTALGWTGTGVVCDLTRLGRGVIGVRTSSDRVITRFIKQVRPILAYWELFREGPDDPAYWAVLLLVHLVGQLARGLQLTLGQARQDGLWIAIRETRTHA